MQGSAQTYGTNYLGSGMTLIGSANPSQPGPAAQGPTNPIAAQQFPPPTAAPTAPVLDDMLLPTEAEAAGLLCSVQLPVSSASPTQSAWCPVSNLLAVAFTPELGSSTARILIIEPSNAEDVTRLELPMAGPGDWISSLQWSWPGQRRALLCATASGRVVVWTQPSQQGQDDAVLPRCIDDWHGQLLLDVSSSSAGAAGAADELQPSPLKHEPGALRSGFGSAAAAAGGGGGVGSSPCIKHEPGYEPDDMYGRTPGGGESQLSARTRTSPVANRRMQPALSRVCWLRQPTGGRSWSTTSLATKRLDACGDRAAGGGGASTAGHGQAQGPGPGSGGGDAGSQPESFDSLFCDDASVPGAVPHWARPNQLTAAVLTAAGSLTILWVMASKLPNTLAWYRSKSIRIPLPPEAAGEVAAESGADVAAAAALGGGPNESGALPEWRIVRACLCAVHDGSLAVAVVYDRRRDAVYLYGMRGNPTVNGQLLTLPGAPVAGAGGGGGSERGPGRDAPGPPQPTVAVTGRLAVPQGLCVRQCRLHLYGGGVKRLYVLAYKPSRRTASHSGIHTWKNHPHHQPPQQQPQQQQPAVIFCCAEALDEKGSGGGGGWRIERSSQPFVERYGGAGSSPATAADGLSLDLGVSVDGSKLVMPYGSLLYTLDSETLTVLATNDLAQCLGPAEAPVDPTAGGTGRLGSSYSNVYGNGNGIVTPTEAAAAMQPAVVAVTGCLSANSCCLCSVVRVRQRNRDPAAASGGGPGFWPDGGIAGATGDGGGGGCDGGDSDDGVGDDGVGDVVMLGISTVPDVVPPPAGSAAAGGAVASLERLEDAIACNMDTLRLAWGALNRLSVWDVAERLRCAWLGGRTEHVYRALDQLDGLLYGTEDPTWRVSLSQQVTRAKLEVLRRLPHPQAAVLAADLLAGARVLQYSDTLAPLYGAQSSEALSHPETRTLAAHMVWFVLEVLTLMLAGLKLWAETAAADKAAARAAAAAAAAAAVQGEEVGGGASAASALGGTGGLGAEAAGWLPLIRLFPDYNLQKHIQAVLLGIGVGGGSAKSSGAEGRSSVQGMHPAIQELLGGSEVSNRARILTTAMNHINKHLQRVLCVHVHALLQQQNGGASAGAAGQGQGAGSPQARLIPGAPIVPLTASEAEQALKTWEMPRALMQRVLSSIFPGPFHLHYCRAKGLITPGLLVQCFRSEELAKLSPAFSLSRESLLERYRVLGLQAQLLDPRQAPHAAARKLWMGFRCPAPPPQLHSHILTQHVSTRQRQRWRRQRGATLALGSSAPLWANAPGPLVDCLTSVPLPPRTSWSLEGAAAVGAVTAQMGPGVGAAGARRNLPPLLAAVQRAWVCCAPPAELGSLWKRARLGLEHDLEY